MNKKEEIDLSSTEDEAVAVFPVRMSRVSWVKLALVVVAFGWLLFFQPMLLVILRTAILSLRMCSRAFSEMGGSGALGTLFPLS